MCNSSDTRSQHNVWLCMGQRVSAQTAENRVRDRLKATRTKRKVGGGLTQSTFSGAVTTLELTERETLIKSSELNYTYLFFSMQDCLLFGLSTMFGIKAKDEIKLSGFRDST